MTLGQQIKTLRLHRQLTQQEVAKRAQLDDSAVSFVESDRKCRFETIAAIRRALKPSADEWGQIKLLWLENQSGEPAPAAAIPTLAAARATRRTKLLEAIATALPASGVDEQLLLALLADRRFLAALPQVANLYRALAPDPHP